MVELLIQEPEKQELTAAEKDLIASGKKSVTWYKTTDEYEQIRKNYAYFEGGLEIEKSMRGGYKRFDLGSLSTESSERSPKGGDTLWRAPAQKDDEKWVDFALRRLEYINYTRLIVSERGSILYKSPPVRTIEGPNAKAMLEVYSDPLNSAKGKFLSFHINALLGGTVAVIPIIDTENGKVYFKGYPRSNFHAVTEALTGKLAYLTIFGTETDWVSGKKYDFHQVWGPEGIYTCRYDPSQRRESVQINRHYCGEVPACLFRENSHDLIAPTYGEIPATDIVNGNEELNIHISNLTQACDYQAFSLLFTVNVPPQARVGPAGRLEATNVTGDRPVSANYLNPSAQLGELQNIINTKMEMLFQTGRVPQGVVFPDRTATSGIHLMIQWFPMQKLFEESKVYYGDNERRLAETLNLVMTRWMKESETANIQDIEFDVDFDESNVMPRDDETRIKMDEWDISMGLKSPVQIMMERNPDLSEEEAIAEIQHVKDLNKKAGFIPGGKELGTFRAKPTRQEILEEIEAPTEE